MNFNKELEFKNAKVLDTTPMPKHIKVSTPKNNGISYIHDVMQRISALEVELKKVSPEITLNLNIPPEDFIKKVVEYADRTAS